MNLKIKSNKDVDIFLISIEAIACVQGLVCCTVTTSGWGCLCLSSPWPSMPPTCSGSPVRAGGLRGSSPASSPPQSTRTWGGSTRSPLLTTSNTTGDGTLCMEWSFSAVKFSICWTAACRCIWLTGCWGESSPRTDCKFSILLLLTMR